MTLEQVLRATSAIASVDFGKEAQIAPVYHNSIVHNLTSKRGLEFQITAL